MTKTYLFFPAQFTDRDERAHFFFSSTSGWYRRSEFGLRASLFFSAATVSGAFGGLLSAAISKMDGVGGYSGWRWIFIIIGLATFCIGILSIWLCEDFPDTAKFLTEEERSYVIQRLQSDQKYSAAGEKFTLDALWKAVFDWKTWVGMLIYMGVDGKFFFLLLKMIFGMIF